MAVAVVFVLSSPAHAQTLNWLGGHASNGSWNAAGNMNALIGAGSTTTDVTFDNLTRALTNDTGGSRIVRSITYGSNITSAFTSNMTSASTLTFQAASGNASIYVNPAATGNITFFGNASYTGSQVLGSHLDVTHNGSGLLLFNRQFSGTGGITKLGSGTMEISAPNNNTFSGPVNVNAGRLVMGSTASATGDLGTASAINFGGGTLEIQSGNISKTISNNITVSSASTLAYNNNFNVSRQLVLNTGSIVLNSNLTVQNISTNTTLDSVINNSRNITGSGNMIVETYNNVTSSTSNYSLGRVALGGNNTGWSGNLEIRKGTAEIYGNYTTSGQVNPGTGTIIIGETGNAFGAGLLMSPDANTNITYVNNIIVRSGGFRTIRSGKANFAAGSDTFYTFNGNVALEGDLNLHLNATNSDRRITLGGNVTGVGGLDFSRASGMNGHFRLAGNNTYSGATTLNADADVYLMSATGIGDSSAVTFAGANSILRLNAAGNETVGSIASTGTNGTIALGANTLITGGNNASTSFGGAINGTGGLTKVGTGLMTLTGANTFTGATAVNGGGMILDGTLTSNVNVASGTRFGGDGTITGNLNIDAGGSFVFSLTQTFDVTGTVSLANSFGVGSLLYANGSTIDWSLVSAGTYNLIGTTASSFANISNFGSGNALLTGGKSVYFQNGLQLSVTAVPEPSTYMILIMGALGLVVVLRRRSRIV